MEIFQIQLMDSNFTRCEVSIKGTTMEIGPCGLVVKQSSKVVFAAKNWIYCFKGTAFMQKQKTNVLKGKHKH